MLPDPFQVCVPSDAYIGLIETAINAVGSRPSVFNCNLSDLSPGATTRVGTFDGVNPVKVSISHSTSKENAPYVTNRSVIRIDFQKPDALGKIVTMSSYLVIALPQGGVFSIADATRQASMIALLTLAGPINPGASTWDGLVPDMIKRILQGEP